MRNGTNWVVRQPRTKPPPGQVNLAIGIRKWNGVRMELIGEATPEAHALQLWFLAHMRPADRDEFNSAISMLLHSVGDVSLTEHQRNLVSGFIETSEVKEPV
jgi:hypothetical protein